MNKNILMIMGGGLLIAIVVALMVEHGLTPKSTGGAKVPTVKVLAANKVLFAGQDLKAADTYWRDWPKDLLYTGLIKKSDQKDPSKLTYYGSPLRHDIEPDEPITTESIITNAKGNYLAAFINTGMRAVSIRVQANTDAAGFITPGDHVDVMLSYVMRLSNTAQKIVYGATNTHHVTEIILANVKVLAIDQKDKSADHSAKVAQTVTLEVTPKGAEKLALAQQMGQLTLALRRLGDDSKAKDVSITSSDVSQMEKQMDELVWAYMSAKTHKTGPQSEVRVYNGNTVENVPVRQQSR